MYYNSLYQFSQLVVSSNRTTGMVICKEDLCAVSAAFDMKHRHVAELAAVGDADEATAGKIWADPAPIVSRTG